MQVGEEALNTACTARHCVDRIGQEVTMQVDTTTIAVRRHRLAHGVSLVNANGSLTGAASTSC